MAERPYWQGKLVRLRGIEPGDEAFHFAIDQQRFVDRNLEMIHPPTSLGRTRHWVEKAYEPGFRQGDNAMFQIIALADDRHVGSIDTHHCDPRVGVLSYGIAMLEEARGKGYAAEAVLLVLRYYFQEKRYQKAEIGVFDFNASSIRLHEKLGFVQEGRQRRHTFTGGAFHDMLLYGMTVEEFREKHPEYVDW